MTQNTQHNEGDEDEPYNQLHDLAVRLHREGHSGEEILESVRRLDSLLSSTIAKDYDDD